MIGEPEERSPNPPGVSFRDSLYTVCRYNGENYYFSTASSGVELHRFMDSFLDEIVGVRVNGNPGDIGKALESFFAEEAVVERGEYGTDSFIYADEVDSLTFEGEDCIVLGPDEVYENAEARKVQEVT